MNEVVLLDFELSKKQLEALNLHSVFRQNESYADIENDLDDIDQIQVWFQVDYNDNTYDVKPIYFDLISNGKIVRKVKSYIYHDLEISEYDGDQGIMQSFIITPKML